MKKSFINIAQGLVLVALIATTPSCKKDYTDPSRATEDKIFTTPTGLTGVTVGLQRVYSLGRGSSFYNSVSIDALVTKQVKVLNAGNLAEAQLETGGVTVDGTNTMLLGLWTTSNKIIYDADKVIANAKNLTDKGYASGLIGHATIFKALSLGNMANFWTHVPDGNGDKVNFITATDAYNRAITAIDEALAAISATAISSAFTANIPAGLDIPNTLRALKARYALYAGKYADALAAANSVDLTKKSTLNFDAANLNTIFETCASNFNVYQSIDSTLGLPAGIQPDLADKRTSFYVGLSGAAAWRWVIKGFGGTSTAAFPVYLPGEVTLIKAEAYVRQSSPDLTSALTEVNKVVTKTAAADPLGVGAALPALTGPYTADQLLTEIYKQRCIEMYMSGQKLVDMRRFGRATTERTRSLMPFPFRERDNNPNTPADPTF
ncbi:MAG: RagB/SusD family nutrient uptake outer membrane protein [Chitinophagaceae bacterium]|uniref:RagB/SusD family nutrient uptake outer membrane protein n=1 Tax=unclassified Paraflavitalea TaxID=2798305 RepID=UPI003D347C65|nr:RagB/SusD family nutrient uptake outer membrane protein [Chitinophagaceae bacterium]